ncbi:MAG TPA: hypothetical protein VHF22_03685 [Planctomycetota bacterium]|nr:hypothetical protein [Planctomycetota bacterium]
MPVDLAARLVLELDRDRAAVVARALNGQERPEFVEMYAAYTIALHAVVRAERARRAFEAEARGA